MTAATPVLPREFIMRRVHSLFGLFIVLFLIEHIITNSQAALLLGEDGEGFIRAVNFLKNLPYLPFLEIFLIGVPLLFHGVLGIKYALTSKANSYTSDGSKPALKKYPRNQAYTWQRLTSWILLVGIILHVGYMRFYRYPSHAQIGATSYYFTRVDMDEGLYTVATRLGATLYSPQRIEDLKVVFSKESKPLPSENISEGLESKSVAFDEKMNILLNNVQTYSQKENFLKALMVKPITKNQVIVQTSDFGTATLLMVRDAFKSPIKGVLYTIFVLSAVFHAFNGLWTFCITWGVVLSLRTQSRLVNVCVGIMIIIGFLGLAGVWGTYFANLRY